MRRRFTPGVSCVSSTSFKRDTFVLTWKIHNVRKVLSTESSAVSSSELKPNSYSSWKMSLARTTEVKHDLQYRHVHLYLKRTEDFNAGTNTSQPLQVFLKAWVKGTNSLPTQKEKKFFLYKPSKLFHFGKGDCSCLRLGVPEKRIMNRRSDLLGADGKHLTFRCKITVFQSLESVSFDKPTTVVLPSAEPRGTLATDLLKMMAAGTMTDVILRVGGVELRAHRCILAARCEYYRALFEEKAGNVITLECDDIEDVNSMKALLHYLYTDELVIAEQGIELPDDQDDLTYIQHLREVLYLADKMNLKHMLELVESRAMEALSPKSAVDLLALGDLYNAPHLKRAAIRFIKENALQLKNSEAWLALIKQRPQLCVDILCQE